MGAIERGVDLRAREYLAIAFKVSTSQRKFSNVLLRDTPASGADAWTCFGSMRSSLAVAASISDNWTDGLKMANYSTRSESLLCPMFTTHPLGVLVKLAFAVLGVLENLVATFGKAV